MQKLSITLGLFLASLIGFAQTDEINLQKYWKLRGDLRENFVKIGSEEGNSIVARAQKPLGCFDNIPLDPLTGSGTNFGTIHWGDGMIRHGYYLGLLATEYRLLKDAGEDVSGVLNELYYALETINRLDLKAEPEIGFIYNYSLTQNKNGFYLREDIPEGYAEDNWADAKIEARCVDSPHYSNDDAAKTIEHPNSYQNTPSTDQLSSLMLGFALINKLVDNEFVQPTASDAGFYVKTEMKVIATRMVNYLREHNWFYIDVNGWPVNNGGDDFVYASYALEKFVADLNGTAINSSSFYRNITMYTNAKRVKRDQYCITGKEVAGTDNSSQAEACNDVLNGIALQLDYLPIHNILTDNSSMGYTLNNETTSSFQTLHFTGTPFIPFHLFSSDLYDFWNGGSQNIIDTFSVNDNLTIVTNNGHFSFTNKFKKSENNLGDPDNYLLMMNIGVATKLYDVVDANYFTDLSGNHQLELIAAVLNNQFPTESISFYKTLLNQMSSTGPFNLYYSDPNTFISQSGNWASYDRWTSNEDALGGYDKHKGIFNGLDYLLFHNLFRLIFKNTLGEISLNETCFCETIQTVPLSPPGDPSNLFVNKMKTKLPNCTKDYFGSSFSIVNTQNVTPFFPNYSDINVFTPQYLISSLNIANTGILNVRTRYILCGNSIMVSNVGGIMNIKKAGVFARSNSKIYSSGDIVVEAGTTLKFTDNSSFRLWGKLIIKDGGTVDFGGAEFLHYPGAKIYMEGPNSKLILHKDITLMGTQDFEIVQLGTQHGQIIIDGPDVKIISTTNLSKVNLIGKDKTKPFITLTNNSKLSHLNNNGTFLKIQHGTISFGENAKLDFRQPFYGAYLNVVSTKVNGGFIFQDFSELLYSDFSNVPITANLNLDNVGTLDILGCNFVQPNTLVSYPAALIKVTGRGFDIVNSNLNSSRSFGVQSSSLTLASSFNGSTITTPFTGSAITGFIGIQDVSNVEIYVNRSIITKCNKGISKLGGKLTVRCSDFNSNKQSNISVEDNCLLNMSSYSNAGYNKLMKTFIDRNIELKTVSVPNLVAGYNYIEACLTPTNTLYGTINTTCTSCASIIASYNQWNTGLTNPGNISSLINAGGFTYTTSTFPMALKPKNCPTDPILPGDPNGGGTAGKMGNSLDTITPVIFSQHFQDSILINELIYQAASKISLITEDSSNNLLAVNLLDELFSSNLSKTDSLNNFYLNYGLDLMKMAVESGFREDELFRNNNSTSFDPYVAKYVDAMMYMTDALIDSSNYEMQYVLEIDKAHLMRLTGHPEIGLNILTELENCGLDSIAQANLNFWKQEYETDIIIKQIGQEYLDSTISIDTSTYINPVLAMNNYSFGSIINDVNDIQFTNCDFFFSKELNTGKVSNEIAVYPNPATSSFDVAIKSPNEGLCTIQIMQLDGKTICAKQFDISFNYTENILSENWPSGVYTLLVTLPNKEQKRFKVLIQ